MRNQRTTTERLADHAGVTELHVDYMRSCAKHWYQVEYLLEVLDEIGYPPGVFETSSGRTRVAVQVSNSLYERVQKEAAPESVNQFVIQTLKGRT